MYGELVDVPPDQRNPTTTESAGQSVRPASVPPAGFINAVLVIVLLSTAEFAAEEPESTNAKADKVVKIDLIKRVIAPLALELHTAATAELSFRCTIGKVLTRNCRADQK